MTKRQPLPGSKANRSVSGTWSGILERGSQLYRLLLEIADDGGVRLVRRERNSQSHPGSLTLTATGTGVAINFPTLRAEFAGGLVTPNRIDGSWRQSGFSFPIMFSRGTAALSRPIRVPALTQARLTEHRARAGLPALAAASSRRGGPLQLWIIGERAVGSNVAIHEHDLWHLGSLGKSMTAVLVARLVDVGALSWDDTVGDLLQAIASEMNPVYRPATLRHLLSHRAGLPTNIGAEHLHQFSQNIEAARAERKVYVRNALMTSPHSTLAAAFRYSNCGYIIAAAMVEQKLGQSFENLIRAHVFAPLKLASAGFGPPGHHGALHQPVGHTLAVSGTQPNGVSVVAELADVPAVFGPAGRVHMSLPDLMLYLISHRDRTSFLSAPAWRTVHSPPFGGDYALGWFIREDGALWHNGSNDFWYMEALVDRARGIASAAVANAGPISPEVGRTLLEASAAARSSPVR